MHNTVHICCYGYSARTAYQSHGDWTQPVNEDVSNPLFFVSPRVLELHKSGVLSSLNFSTLVTGNQANIRQNFDKVMEFIVDAFNRNISAGLPREIQVQFHLKHREYFMELFMRHQDRSMHNMRVEYLNPSAYRPPKGLFIPYSRMIEGQIVRTVIAYDEAFSYS